MRPFPALLPAEAGQEEGEEGAAEGEAPRSKGFIRGDGALFAAGIAAGLSHFLPSHTASKLLNRSRPECHNKLLSVARRAMAIVWPINPPLWP